MAICSVDSCNLRVGAKGMCQRHYQQMLRRNNKKTCTIPGCNAPHAAKGLCNAHWLRQYKHGHTDLLTMHGSSVMERIMDKVVFEPSGCWIFTGSISGGYGMIGMDKKVRLVHVVTYEDKYGPVPNGLELHHFYCNRKVCCNPDHVTPLTRSEHKLEHFAMKRDE